jgi:hypothetical protein
VRRQLLQLCLLAYPRARRNCDREYLRDLALDLAETQGLLRQATSLLLGGIRERIEARRGRAASLGTWIARAGVTSFLLAALALAATSLIAAPEGDREHRREVEVTTCLSTDQPPPKPAHARANGEGECVAERRLVASRVQAGFDCATHRRAGHERLVIAWRCTRHGELVASRGL